MKKLLLLLVLLPFAAYCANSITLFHVNDGKHLLYRGQTFTASEVMAAKSNAITTINIACGARDTGYITPVKIKWTAVVNDYKWSYNENSNVFSSQGMLPPGNVVYKIVVTGTIDDPNYKGPYATIICSAY